MFALLASGWFILPIPLIFFCLYQHKKEESGSSVVATVFTVIAVVLFAVQLYLIFPKLPVWAGEAQAQLADKLARIQ